MRYLRMRVSHRTPGTVIPSEARDLQNHGTLGLSRFLAALGMTGSGRNASRVVYLLCSLFSRLSFLILITGCASQTAPSTTQRLPSPIEYRHEARADPALHLHLVTVDLTDPRVQVCAYPSGDDPDGEGFWQMSLQTVRETARKHDLDVAVNANFFMSRQTLQIAGRRVPYFAGNWARAVGWLMSHGKLINTEPAEASVVVDDEGRVTIAKFDKLPEGARHVVSGSQMLLTNGRITARGSVLAPHTAAGVNPDRTRLILLVVDGRLLSHSVGMTEPQLAQEMLRLGCSDAINLDGGGSSTLVVREGSGAWEVLNRPSDGHDLKIPLSLERSVACVLGVRIRDEDERRE